MKSILTIGEAADRFGLAPHVLRHWESVGLLAPARAEAERRRYGHDDLFRVAAILRAKEAGFGLDDIREMITAGGGPARREVLLRHRTELLRRIAEAQASLDLLDCALTCTHEDVTTCPRFRALLTEHAGVSAD